MKRVLFVDDDRAVLATLRRLFRADLARWDLAFVDSAAEALAAFADAPFDVVITDQRMPGMTGDQLLAVIRDRYPDTVRIMLSGTAHPSDTELAQYYFTKPCDHVELRALLDRVLG